LWYGKHKGELQHLLWPAQSPHLNITEPLCSVLEARVTNRLPPLTSLMQLEDTFFKKNGIKFC
jgi:hypothetical protein